jgi:hypothetical protein
MDSDAGRPRSEKRERAAGRQGGMSRVLAGVRKDAGPPIWPARAAKRGLCVDWAKVIDDRAYSPGRGRIAPVTDIHGRMCMVEYGTCSESVVGLHRGGR